MIAGRRPRLPVYSKWESPMAHIVEIQNKTVIFNDDLADMNLPVGTRIDQADGHYVSIGMDLEGPFSCRRDAEDKVDHLKRATRLALDEVHRRSNGGG
jgi:hypothetical protein